MIRKPLSLLALGAALCATLGVTACKTVGDVWNYESAERISAPANLLKRQVAADPFSITVYEKIHKMGDIADIYFEGDGTLINAAPTPDKPAPAAKTEERTANLKLGTDTAPAGVGAPETVSASNANPTPSYPLALHLAAFDNASNVIYIARPCQFSGMLADAPGTLCTKDYWSKGRYSIEAMNAMNTVLDEVKARYRLSGFNLIGYDGGAAVAVLMGAKRHDVLSIRTVGGNLDIDRNAADHKQPQPEDSLNPKDFARDVAAIPQQHFLGQWDRVIAPDVYQSFKDAMGPSGCIRYSLIADVDHENGWANRWPSLLEQPLDCKADQK